MRQTDTDWGLVLIYVDLLLEVMYTDWLTTDSYLGPSSTSVGPGIPTTLLGIPIFYNLRFLFLRDLGIFEEFLGDNQTDIVIFRPRQTPRDKGNILYDQNNFQAGTKL